MRFVHRRAVFTYEVTKKCLQNLVQTLSEVALSQRLFVSATRNCLV